MARDSVEDILSKYKTVAVIGLSRDPSKDSNKVAQFLKDRGYRVVPVNPTVDKVLDEKSYKSLSDIPAETQKIIEIVDIFRPSSDVPPIIDQATKIKEHYDHPYVIWMQLGIINEQAAATARAAGFLVVMNRCMMQEYKRHLPNTVI